jgi:hypothetical protein
MWREPTATRTLSMSPGMFQDTADWAIKKNATDHQKGSIFTVQENNRKCTAMIFLILFVHY